MSQNKIFAKVYCFAIDKLGFVITDKLIEITGKAKPYLTLDGHEYYFNYTNGAYYEHDPDDIPF